jgi:NAD(P)-dependent dehydrogenase (short-subunit alcohol dehydrogenase family)
MTLGDGIPGSLFSLPPPLPRNASPNERAAMRFRLVGSGAIVTGGAGDLGFVASRALLEHGLQGLMIFDMNPEEAAVNVKILESEFPGTIIRFTKVDITDATEVAAAVLETAKVLGSVDILLNFAGVVMCQHAIDMTPNEWNQTMNVNTTGSFLCAQAVARQIKKQGTGGSMVFIASISAHRVNFPQ